DDIFELAAYSVGKGIRTVMAPCGQNINQVNSRSIKESGIRRISVSLDGACPGTHDFFRGVPGSFEGSLQGIEYAKGAGLQFQINTTVSKHNIRELPRIYELAVKLGAAAFDIFFMVLTGRAADLKDLELSAACYEETLHWVAATAATSPILVKTTCAPHYARIANGNAAFPATQRVSGGCLGGKGFIFISHQGIVQPCGFLDIDCGNLRNENFNVLKIYDESKIFQELRDVDHYQGKCGICEFNRICGGCRARAYSHDRNYLGAEPLCVHIPGKNAERDPA
ncbi:MAG: SPASM domain-containing protein, partial [Victivallaceae bacterium]